MSSKKRWQLIMFAFIAFFLVILAGFSPDIGREMSQREEGKSVGVYFLFGKENETLYIIKKDDK
mgnify:CR=1 FL=1